VDEGDLALFDRFLPSGQQPEKHVSLTEKILEKIAEHEARLAGHPMEEAQASALPPKVIEVYTKSVTTKIFPCLTFG
jgi:essential nuclear protein 1